jgi:hypothetical protein
MAFHRARRSCFRIIQHKQGYLYFSRVDETTSKLIKCANVGWIHLAQDTAQWQAPVKLKEFHKRQGISQFHFRFLVVFPTLNNRIMR